MSLRVDMTGDGSGFRQMLDQARTQAKAFSNSVTHEVGSSWASIGKGFAAGFAGMFTIEGLKSGVEWFIRTGKEIKETSEQVEMSAQSWQKWSQAVEEAGLSTGGFMRVIEALRQKRTEALSDPKARGQLTRLGFTDDEIAGGMDMDEFLKRALSNASGGDLQRKYLADVIGTRGLKYGNKGVLENFEHATPVFKKEDLELADDSEKAVEHAKHEVGRAATSMVDYARFVYHLFTWSKKDWDIDALNHGKTLGKLASDAALDEQNRRKARDNAQTETGNGSTSAPANTEGTTKPEKDPLDAILDRQREQMSLHEQQRQQQLTDSQRSLMTIGDRRAGIQKEWKDLGKQIAERKAKMQAEGFLSEADKADLEGVTGKARELKINELRQKYQDTTDSLQIRQNRLQGDLKEKPLSFSADSMSKVGLYSASSVSFNPLLGIAEKQLTAMQQIVVNTNAWAKQVMGDKTFRP